MLFLRIRLKTLKQCKNAAKSSPFKSSLSSNSKPHLDLLIQKQKNGQTEMSGLVQTIP